VVRALDALAIVLLLVAVAAFGVGVHSLTKGADFRALYLLALGGLALKGSTDLIRPKGST
jgi:hypothetical protein